MANQAIQMLKGTKKDYVRCTIHSEFKQAFLDDGFVMHYDDLPDKVETRGRKKKSTPEE